MYKLQPSLFNAPKGRSKKSKRGKEAAPVTDPKVARLQHKLKKIADDVLFEADQAEEEWQVKLEELRVETEVSERQKLEAPETDQDEDAQTETTPQAEDENDGALGLLGDMFAPEESSANETPLLGIPINTITKQRDFGKSSGMNPRRILEEACRARLATLSTPLFYCLLI